MSLNKVVVLLSVLALVASVTVARPSSGVTEETDLKTAESYGHGYAYPGYYGYNNHYGWYPSYPYYGGYGYYGHGYPYYESYGYYW